MAECENLAGCPFFNDRMANMPITAEMINMVIKLIQHKELASPKHRR